MMRNRVAPHLTEERFGSRKANGRSKLIVMTQCLALRGRHMRVLGHGVDVVDLPRIRPLLLKNDDFVLGWFTAMELEELGPRIRRADVVGGRVAAKEAVSKALGTGFSAEV